MKMSKKQIGLASLAALTIGAAQIDHLAAQEPNGPIDVLLSFVREHVAVAVPPDQRPYDPERIFLRIWPAVSDRSVLGSLEKRNLDRLGITLAEAGGGAPENWVNAIYTQEDGTQGNVLVFDTITKGAHVRDHGVLVDIAGVKRLDHGALAFTIAYYVTILPDRQDDQPSLCLEGWYVTLKPARGGWEIAEKARGVVVKKTTLLRADLRRRVGPGWRCGPIPDRTGGTAVRRGALFFLPTQTSNTGPRANR